MGLIPARILQRVLGGWNEWIHAASAHVPAAVIPWWFLHLGQTNSYQNAFPFSPLFNYDNPSLELLSGIFLLMLLHRLQKDATIVFVFSPLRRGVSPVWCSLLLLCAQRISRLVKGRLKMTRLSLMDLSRADLTLLA